MQSKFVGAITSNQTSFGLELSSNVISALTDYYVAVQRANPLLHLVAPCTPEEFAVRHILESLAMIEFLPTAARFADVGTGAGLPAIPCLIARGDLRATLIESKEKKAAFLTKTVASLGLSSRAQIVNCQYSEVTEPGAKFVSCRALDRFVDQLPRLLRWTAKRSFLFFGGPTLGEALERQKTDFETRLLPMSEQRFLFIGKAAR